MTDQKKTRQMTPRGFLSKATKGSTSAVAFMAAHREYMTTGELAPLLSPIVAKVDSREMMPTPALTEIAKLVMDHIINSEISRAVSDMDEGGPSKGTTKNWKVTILNSKDEVQTRITSNGEVEELIRGFDLASDADRWADRRLFEAASDCYAVVEHTSLKVQTIIMRQDALARMLKKKKGPSVHVSGQSTKKLGFGPHVKQKRVSFSHG